MSDDEEMIRRLQEQARKQTEKLQKKSEATGKRAAKAVKLYE